ncbi:hypothetical protein ACPCYY_21560, partial [Bacillus pumilus]|uniref:hypothetical protein n=1 Tax=Bacillus pumilus TaxID=1408 RepID=UPI003C2A3CBE
RADAQAKSRQPGNCGDLVVSRRNRRFVKIDRDNARSLINIAQFEDTENAYAGKRNAKAAAGQKPTAITLTS